LIDTVRRTGAKRVGVTHGSSEALARYLAEREGVETFVVPTRYQGEGDDAGAAGTGEVA
jgi:putative mRNA 3-end processing factor